MSPIVPLCGLALAPLSKTRLPGAHRARSLTPLLMSASEPIILKQLSCPTLHLAWAVQASASWFILLRNARCLILDRSYGSQRTQKVVVSGHVRHIRLRASLFVSSRCCARPITYAWVTKTPSAGPEAHYPTSCIQASENLPSTHSGEQAPPLFKSLPPHRASPYMIKKITDTAS